MSRGVTISPDVLEVGFHSVQLPQPTNGYRNISADADGIVIVVTREELRSLKERLNEMDLK